MNADFSGYVFGVPFLPFTYLSLLITASYAVYVGVRCSKKTRIRIATILKRHAKTIGLFVAVALVIIGIFSIEVAPLRAFNGVVWMNKGPKYISDEEVSSRMLAINSPAEKQIERDVQKQTKSCASVP
ncbi:MAG: hypothetical protein M3P98_02635, partial [bacterium]|nr:hypothetical protein [bacterium]